MTLVNFALFDLVGLQLSPRIRDLGKITLYRTGANADFVRAYQNAGPLLTRRLDTGLIAEHWDDLLRLAGSLKFGHATASLIVGKLSRSDRQQNAFAAALKEWGALRRTIYAARYLADETYRRKIARQLNKGESLHALRRDLLYAHEGAIRRRRLEQQTEQARYLTLVTNSVVTWTTEYGPIPTNITLIRGHKACHKAGNHTPVASIDQARLREDVLRNVMIVTDGGDHTVADSQSTGGLTPRISGEDPRVTYHQVGWLITGRTRNQAHNGH